MILNKIKNLSIRNRIIVTFLSYSILIFLIVYFIILPRLNFIRESGKNIVERRIYLEQQYIKAKNFRKNNEEMKLVDEDIQRLDDVFVSYDKDLEFIETLEEVATNNSVVQDISLEKIEEEKIDDFAEITLEIIAEGNFLNIINYIIDLETLGYYVNISSLELTKHEVSLDRGVLEEQLSPSNKIVCKIIADTYWK